MPKKKIILATIGAHGDIHPFIAIGLELQARGFEPLFLGAHRYEQKVSTAGIAFRAVGPTIAEYERELGMSALEIGSRVTEPGFYITRILMPFIPRFYADSASDCADAAAIVTHPSAYAAKLLAEQYRIPHFGIAITTSVLWSVYDPPILAEARALSTLTRALGRTTSRMFKRRVAVDLDKMAAPLIAMRDRLHLPRIDGPLFDGLYAGNGAIALYSPLLARVQPDHPKPTSIAGFQFYDTPDEGQSRLSPATLEFLANGDAPVVFTLGSAKIYDTNRFVETCLDATRRLGVRALFALHPFQEQFAHLNGRHVHVTGYAPFSLLFESARAIVHHSGIGTLGLAMRAGHPQLLIPTQTEQLDGALRAARLGIARVVASPSLTANGVTRHLRALLTKTSYARRSRAVADVVARENGAAVAADLIARAAHRS